MCGNIYKNALCNLCYYSQNSQLEKTHFLTSYYCLTSCFTDNKLDADLWLLNSCTVKNPAEDHFRNEITSARKLGKYIVLAGCVPQGQPKSDYVQVSSMVNLTRPSCLQIALYIIYSQ